MIGLLIDLVRAAVRTAVDRLPDAHRVARDDALVEALRAGQRPAGEAARVLATWREDVQR